MPSIVIGKVKGERGEKGFSPTVTLTKNENILSISVTDETGTKTESIDTGEAVQADWNTTDTALNSYIKNKPEIPSKVSQLQNDSGYLTDYTETDPTVPAWAKKATKPEYTAVEVGALPSDTTHLSGDVPITRKVNGKTLNADITLSATDVGALPDTTTIPTALTDFGVTATASELNYVDGVTSNIQTQLNAKAATESPTLTGTPKAPTASADTNNSQIATTAFAKTAVSDHNDSTTAHSDIRNLIAGLTTRMNALADSDDTTLDQLSEIVAYIKANRTLIESVTTNKINVTDIVDNLTSTATNKPLSAKQGKALNDLITSLTSTVNTKVGDLQDAIDGKAASSHTHKKSEISDFPTSMTPTAHNQASNTINAMTGYSKPSSTSAIKTTDTLNAAIGKLEKALDSKGTSNLTIGTTSTTAAAGNHTHSSYVNQNAFSNVTVGSTTVSADSATDTLTLVAGSNVTITPDATNDKITISATDTNTHYASGTVVNNSATATSNTSSALTNGKVYLNHIENGGVKNSHKISGSGATTVTSDSSGNIIISSSDTNTDTKNTAGSTNTSSKIFLVGATSQAANPQTYSHDTAYVGTDGCLYSNSKKVSVEGHTHEAISEDFIRGLFS